MSAKLKNKNTENGECSKMDKVNKILDIIKYLTVKKFTGRLTLCFEFYQGGIRDAKKAIEERIE